VLTDPVPSWEIEEPPQPHLRDYWKALRKHRWTAFAAFLACVVTGALSAFTREPLYTAAASIQIERQPPNVTAGQDVQKTESDGYDKYDYYQTQFEILASRKIAASVIDSLGLAGDPRFVESKRWYSKLLDKVVANLPPALMERLGRAPNTDAGENENEQRILDRYARMLTVLPVRNSRLVMVGFTSRFPDLSAEVVNAHVDEYMGLALKNRLETSGKAKEFLEEEIAKAREQVVAAEATLNDYRKKNHILALDTNSKGDVTADRLNDLNQRYTEAQADRIKLDAQCSLVARRNYESLPDVNASKLIMDLKAELSRVEAERAELASKFKPGYPKMSETIARESQLRARLNTEIGTIVAATQTACVAAKTREDQLKNQVDAERERALAERDVAADYSTLARDAETARSTYATLVQRMKDVDVAKEIRMSNISVVDRALPPLKPSYPRKGFTLALSAAIGLVLGLALAFLLEYLDNTVATQEDVETRLGLPMLGLVPRFEPPKALAKTKQPLLVSNSAGSFAEVPAKRSPVTPTGRELIVYADPCSVASEAHRVVRTALLLSSADNPPQVMIFTSGNAGEGKTVTAINQALALVQGGGRVLLIDADIRQPRLHQVFNVPNGHGLSSFLAGVSGIESVIHEMTSNGAAKVNGNGNGNGANGNGAGHLYVVPSGPMSPNPAELLGGRRMAQLVQDLRSQFDYILFDTPPVLPVADVAVLSKVSDGVVLVVHGQHTPIEVVAACRDRLRQVRARILGVVLNNVALNRSEYPTYYYGYGQSAEHETSA